MPMILPFWPPLPDLPMESHGSRRWSPCFQVPTGLAPVRSVEIDPGVVEMVI